MPSKIEGRCSSGIYNLSTYFDQLAGKCPWYSKAKDSTDVTECPLQKSNCPYYIRHKEDQTVGDVLREKDHHCVLSEKCTFYKALKEGKLDSIDWTTSNCPIKDKCPYYKTVKDDPKKHSDCPILHSCPHFNKHGHGDHHHGHSHVSEAGHDKSCPMKSKCPYYEQYKGSNQGAGEPCPLGNKCVRSPI